MLEKLKKLRGRNLAELKERGLQGANIFAERLGASRQTSLPTDKQLLEKFDATEKIASIEDLLTHFRSRSAVKFYSSFENPQATADALRKHFPFEERRIIERADRIGQGLLDLLGYENLYFNDAVPDWHFDPISQKQSPRVHWSKIEEVNAAQTGDKKIIWELNRHQYFTTLGRAYLLTKNEKYAATLVAHLESWFAENPPKIGVNWLSSLEVAFRSISWIWAFYFFKDSPAFSARVLAQMLKYLYLHGRHLETYLSTYFSPNTHLTGEALGLYYLGTFLPELSEARRWKTLGHEILLKALDFQVRRDGVYCEQASHYHRYTTDFYANLLILRQLEGAHGEAKHREKLESLLEFLLFITQPDGATALFGDDDGGRFHFLDERPITDFRPALALGAVLFGRGDFKFAAREPGAELLWLLGIEGLQAFDALPASEPARASKAFRESGFFAMRSSWEADADFLLVDCGEHGFLNGGHAHADALSFVLSANGEPVFVDSGTYNYTSDPEARRLFRSTSAHNCLTVNGQSSSIPGGPFSWKSTAKAALLAWREDENSVYFRGTHDGFERFGVRYEREISLIKHGALSLRDSIKSEKLNSYELNFILSPDLAAVINDTAVTIFDQKKTNRALLFIYTELTAGQPAEKAGWTIEDCWISPRYGKKVKSRKLIFAARIAGDFEICNIFEKESRMSAGRD